MPLAPPVETAPAYVFAAETPSVVSRLFGSPERLAIEDQFQAMLQHWSSSGMNQLAFANEAALEYRPITPNRVRDILVRFVKAGRAPISAPDIED